MSEQLQLSAVQTELWLAGQTDPDARLQCAELVSFTSIDGADLPQVAALQHAVAQAVAQNPWLHCDISAAGSVTVGAAGSCGVSAHVTVQPAPQQPQQWAQERISCAQNLGEIVLFSDDGVSCTGMFFRLHHVLGDGYSVQGLLHWLIKRAAGQQLPWPFTGTPVADAPAPGHLVNSLPASTPIHLARASGINPGDALLRAKTMLPAQSGATKLLQDPEALAQKILAYTSIFALDEPVVLGFAVLGRNLASPPCFGPQAAVLPYTGALSVRELTQLHGVRAPELSRQLGLPPGTALFGPLLNIRPFPQYFTLPGYKVTIETIATGPVADLEIIVQQGPEPGSVELLLLCYGDPASQPILVAHCDRLAHFLATGEQLTAAEKQQVAQVFQGPVAPLPAATLTELLAGEYRHSHQSTAPALWWQNHWVDHRTKWQQVARIATALKTQGVKPGQIVGVQLPRCPELLYSIAAVLAVGAAWTPLDPEQPAGRIDHMLQVAQPQVVIDETWIATKLPAAATELDFAPRTGEDLAYVLFTSGSTGLPKGVAVSHAALVNRLQWMTEDYNFSRQDVLIQKTPASFDVSIWELVLPFTHGLPVAVPAAGTHKNPEELLQVLKAAAVTICHFVPSALTSFLGFVAAETKMLLPDLRLVITSGEALSSQTAGELLRHPAFAQHLELLNLYGPTEAAIDVTAQLIEPGAQEIPIGKPVANTSCFVLNDKRELVPVGARGTLYLGGIQLAKEYLRDPEKTAARFITADICGKQLRLYDTGDLAAWNHHGELLYFGRSDDQVKLRGQRLELGEVEAQLAAAVPTGIPVAAKVVNLQGEQHLLGFLGLAASAETWQTIYQQLEQQLPAYMVPSWLVPLENFPKTVSGKLDRKNLPVPTPAELQQLTALRIGPAAQQELPAAAKPIAQKFAEVLGAQVSWHTNFFAAGGTSLSAIKLAQALNVTIADFFAAPSVAGIYRLRQEQQLTAGGQGFAPILTLKDEAALSQGQGPIDQLTVCLHPAGGLGWVYNRMIGDMSGVVVAVQSPGFTGTLPESIGAAAGMALAQIAPLVARARRVVLVGWSVGGLLAHEMAARLEAREARPRSIALVLLDAYPGELWATLPEPTPAELERAIAAMAGRRPGEAEQGVFAHLSEQRRGQVYAATKHYARLMREHRSRVFTGPVVHVKAELNDIHFTAASWQPFAAQLVEVSFAVDHPGIVNCSLAEILQNIDC